MIKYLDQLTGDDFAACTGKRAGLILAATWALGTLSLFLFRPGYAFPPFDLLDSWVYTGYQWNLPGHVADFGYVYYGSRLTLVLPGALLHSVLPPVAANIGYKLFESALLAAACAAIAYRARGLPTALLAVVLTLFAPQVIYALHTDYMDTAVILYGALALAGITIAKDSRHWAPWILAAGVAFGCMGVTNLSAIAMPGLGIAIYHLLWTNWGWRRQLASVGLYCLAFILVLGVGGIINLRLGGQFLFMRPQVDMIFYFHSNERNPWTPVNWDWLQSAIWLIVPVSAVVWGAIRSWTQLAGDPVRMQIRALTGALAVSLAVALNLELRGIGVLAYSFYASFQLCFALPLLAICGVVSGRGALSWRWLLCGIGLLTVTIFRLDSASFAASFPRFWNLLPGDARMLVLLAAVLLAVSAVLARLTALRRPELLVVGLFICSIQIGFHGPALSDRLPERYATLHSAFQTLAREFPRGSYRFWMHPDQDQSLPLVSTMLYGYRLFTLQPFPLFEAHNVSHHMLVVPCLPHQGEAVLKVAATEFNKLKIDLAGARVIPIAGERNTGIDLVCFTMVERPVPPADLIEEAERDRVVLDLRFSAHPPYTDEIIQTTFPPKSKTIETSRGFPVYHPTSLQDYLWTPWHPIPPAAPGAARELKLVADMPEDGLCICVVQNQVYEEIRRIPLLKKGRSLHLIAVPPSAITLRIYLSTEGMAPTPLPTALTIYAPP